MTPDQFNRWRIVPRALVLMYSYLVWTVAVWYMLLPDPNTQQTAFVGTIIGVAGAIFNFYVQTGKHPSNNSPETQGD